MRLALALMVLALPAVAQDVDCANAEAQVELTYCAEQDWIAADNDLNDAYQVAMDAMKAVDSNLDAKDRGAAAYLRDAQRAWITFRDANCAAEGYTMHGGSAEPNVIYDCRARLTRQRADDLFAMGEEN